MAKHSIKVVVGGRTYPLSVEEIEIDPPQTGEVKVKIGACAICHSDVHLIRGNWGGDTPVVAGHEGAGVIAEVGSGVTAVKPGDRVVVTAGLPLGFSDSTNMIRVVEIE